MSTNDWDLIGHKYAGCKLLNSRHLFTYVVGSHSSAVFMQTRCIVLFTSLGPVAPMSVKF